MVTVTYIVIWWQDKKPYAATFKDEIQAYAAASVRNALLIECHGKIDKIVDYWRRDDDGYPLKVEWRDMAPPLGLPWIVE